MAAEHGVSVHGLDLSANMVLLALERSSTAGAARVSAPAWSRPCSLVVGGGVAAAAAGLCSSPAGPYAWGLHVQLPALILQYSEQCAV